MAGKTSIANFGKTFGVLQVLLSKGETRSTQQKFLQHQDLISWVAALCEGP
jgi:hypothetical protein